MNIPANLSAWATRICNASLGEGLTAAFASLDVSDADFARLGKLGAAPGQRGVDPFHGVTIRIVRVRGAAVSGVGIGLKRYLGGANRDFTLAAGSTKTVLNTTQTYADNEIGGALLRTTGGTGLNQFRIIRDYDVAANATISIAPTKDLMYGGDPLAGPDALSVLPDGTTTVSIYANWEVTPATAVGDFVSCISLGAATQDNWTIVVERGPTPHLIVGSTDATTQGGPVVPSATTGTGKGPTAAGITAAEAARVYAIDLAAYSGAAALRMVDLLGRFAQ